MVASSPPTSANAPLHNSAPFAAPATLIETWNANAPTGVSRSATSGSCWAMSRRLGEYRAGPFGERQRDDDPLHGLSGGDADARDQPASIDVSLRHSGAVAADVERIGGCGA